MSSRFIFKVGGNSFDEKTVEKYRKLEYNNEGD
jgi:hypothetical protein